MQLLKKYPYAFLLCAQLISVIYYGFFDSAIHNQLLANLLGLVFPLIAVFVVYRTPAVNWIAFTLLFLSVVFILLATQFNIAFLPWAQSFESALYFYAAGSLVMYLYHDNHITVDELFAAAATFTLMVWGFALAYSVCQQVYPHSILAAVNPDAPRTWIELLFMSFSIQSSTGVGDIIPISGPARAISAIQIFAGAMYITVVISRVVGLSASQSTNK